MSKLEATMTLFKFRRAPGEKPNKEWGVNVALKSSSPAIFSQYFMPRMKDAHKRGLEIAALLGWTVVGCTKSTPKSRGGKGK